MYHVVVSEYGHGDTPAVSFTVPSLTGDILRAALQEAAYGLAENRARLTVEGMTSEQRDNMLVILLTKEIGPISEGS